MDFYSRTAPTLWGLPNELKSCIECNREFRKNHKWDYNKCYHCEQFDRSFTTELMACNEAYVRYGNLSKQCEDIMLGSAMLSEKQDLLDQIKYEEPANNLPPTLNNSLTFTPQRGNLLDFYNLNFSFEDILDKSLFDSERMQCFNWFGLGSDKCSRKNIKRIKQKRKHRH